MGLVNILAFDANVPVTDILGILFIGVVIIFGFWALKTIGAGLLWVFGFGFLAIVFLGVAPFIPDEPHEIIPINQERANEAYENSEIDMSVFQKVSGINLLEDGR